MYRYTTPYHSFTVPFDVSTLEEVFVTYLDSKTKTVIVEFDIGSVDLVAPNKVVVHFTQEQSALFACDCMNKAPAYVQLRGKFNNGEAWASDGMRITVKGVYKEGVI